MDLSLWVDILTVIVGLGVTITLALIRILFINLNKKIDNLENKMNDRLRTLQHEDRDIRSTVDGWGKILLQILAQFNSNNRE